MSFFVTSSPARKPKTKNIRTISLALAVVFTGMAVAQLFTFEDFPAVIAHMWLPGDSSVWAAGIVTLEVLALPFLLAMRVSLAMRAVSMVAGWLVVAMWLYITTWGNVSSDIIANSGLLGETISLPVGWWTVLFCMALGVLAAWTAWGMWPFPQKAHK
jgi:hypothetical protein